MFLFYDKFSMDSKKPEDIHSTYCQKWVKMKIYCSAMLFKKREEIVPKDDNGIVMNCHKM